MSFPILVGSLAIVLTSCGLFSDAASNGAEKAEPTTIERGEDPTDEAGEQDPVDVDPIDEPDDPDSEPDSEPDGEPDSEPDGEDEEPTDPVIEDVEPDEDLDEIIDEAEQATEPEVVLPAPVVTFREIAGATPESVEHVAYVEAFWTEVAPELDFEYELVNTDRLFPRSILTGDQTCSFRRIREPIDGEIAEFNAYVTPCDEGVTVVWDDIGLETDLEQRFPGAGMAMLIAHEWGHVIQLQRDQWNDLSDIIAEQQADCYSGAYAAWAEARDIEPFTNDEALDFAIISTLETRDAVGSRPDEFGAHGNGFDRVRATQEGYDRGVTFCDSYEDTPPPITQTGFLSAEDRRNEGNLPYEPAFELLVPAVIEHFEALSDEPLQAFVEEPDEALLRELHVEIGDLAIGTEYALRYGEALQAATGDETDGVGAALQRACLAGSFLEDALANGVGTGSLSPGDLDEAIITLASSDDLLANPGVVFEMVAALRVGTLEGIDACALA